MAQRKLTKAERTAGVRAYDRMMDARGEPWKLKLILDREGEEVVLATLAQFKKRKELTPDMRRTVVQAARLAAGALGLRDSSLDWLMPESYVAKAIKKAAKKTGAESKQKQGVRKPTNREGRR